MALKLETEFAGTNEPIASVDEPPPAELVSSPDQVRTAEPSRPAMDSKPIRKAVGLRVGQNQFGIQK